MKFFVAKKCKPFEIYWKMCDVYGKACFSQIIFPKSLLRSWVEKTVNEVETYWLSGKENVPGAAVYKESHDSILENETNLEKNAAVKCFLMPRPKSNFTLSIE